MPAGAPTNNDADSDSLSGLAPGDAALKAAPALPSTQAPQHSTSAETGIAVTPLSPLQPPRAQSQATTSLPASDHVSTEAHIISGKQLLLLPRAFIISCGYNTSGPFPSVHC